MKWVLTTVCVLAVLVSATAFLGSRLPVKHHATRKAHFRQTPEALYALLAGPPDWRSGVKAYGPLPDRGHNKQWWEQDKRGEKITYELVEDSPPSLRAVRIADQGLPYGGTWTFEVTPVGTADSELRIREDGEIYNVFFRFMARYVLGYTSTIETFLRDAGKKLNQPVNIEA